MNEHFWAHVLVGPGCWEWTGARQPNGYGVFGTTGRTFRAHRFAWELCFGPIPAGLHVCHRCDNRPCVRPSHLFLGTRKDNMGDAVRKGRIAYGERHGSRRLTDEKVREIRRRKAAGEMQRSIAASLGVSEVTISTVLHGHTWTHVMDGAAFLDVHGRDER